jgi:hypothetical protein
MKKGIAIYLLTDAGVSATVSIVLFRTQPSSIGEEEESGFVLHNHRHQAKEDADTIIF